MRVKVSLEVEYELPEPLGDIYSTTDLAECVNIDLDADSAAFFDSVEIIKVVAVTTSEEPPKP